LATYWKFHLRGLDGLDSYAVNSGRENFTYWLLAKFFLSVSKGVDAVLSTGQERPGFRCLLFLDPTRRASE